MGRDIAPAGLDEEQGPKTPLASAGCFLIRSPVGNIPAGAAAGSERLNGPEMSSGVGADGYQEAWIRSVGGNTLADEASNILAGAGRPAGAEAAPPPVAFDDAALLEQCRRGDVRVFGSLVAKYQDRVFNVICRICPNPADAEELAQETFLKALEGLKTFRGQSRFYTWLFRIAVNTALSHQRRAGRIHFHPLSQADGMGQPGAGDAAGGLGRRSRNPRPDQAAITREHHRHVLAALAELEDEFRVVVVLRDIEDMDYKQIGRVLDLPAGTVKSRLHRGRLLLREKLGALQAGDG